MNIKSNRGFSIVEMAVVVVVFGILIAIGIKMLGPLTDRIKNNSTNRILDEAVAGIIGFAQTSARLPTVDEFKTVVKGNKDIWGKPLVYIPDSGLITEGSICSAGSTNTEVNVCTDDTCTAIKETALNTAFFLLSSGENKNIQTNIAVDPIEVYTLGLFGIDDYSTGVAPTDPLRAESYRDISKWMVLPELRLSIGCAGPPLRILDTPLPSGVSTKAYDADVFATSGVPWADAAGPPPAGDDDTADDYKWCITTAPPSGLSYQCNGTLASSASCSIDPAAGTWQRCSYVNITGTPSGSGSYKLHFYARDDADNIDDRQFALTINPFGGLKVCPEYRVWNEKSGSDTDYRIRLGFQTTDPITGNCWAILLHNEITAQIHPLRIHEVLEQHSTGSGDGTEPAPSGSCDGLNARLTFNGAILTDTNGDCCLTFLDNHVIDRVCP